MSFVGPQVEDKVTKRNLLVVLGALVFLLAAGAGHIIGRAASGGDEPSIADVLTQAVAAINKKTPQQIDGATILLAASSGPGLRLNYHYSFSSEVAGISFPQALNAGLKDRVVAFACKNMAPVLSRSILLTYYYKSPVGAYLGEVPVYPSNCGFKDLPEYNQFNPATAQPVSSIEVQPALPAEVPASRDLG